MSEEHAQPMSEDTQAEEQRRCALCYHLFPKDDMEQVQMDEPGAWEWICSGCSEKVQSTQLYGPWITPRDE